MSRGGAVTMPKVALLESLRQSLVTLDRYRLTVERDRLIHDVDAQNMVLFALYRAVQGAIDLGQHCLVERGLPVPAAYHDVFGALSEGGVLTADLGARLQGWVGLRDLIVHDYGVLDMQLLAQGLEDHLVDLHELIVALTTDAVDGSA